MKPPTPTYEFGDVVIAEVEYTDGRGWKRRPALIAAAPPEHVVASATAFNRDALDVVIMPISTELRHRGRLGYVEIRDWKAAGLHQPSVIKPVLTSLPHAEITKTIGKVDSVTRVEIKKAIGEIFGLKAVPRAKKE